jgi:hypothetical protein
MSTDQREFVLRGTIDLAGEPDQAAQLHQPRSARQTLAMPPWRTLDADLGNHETRTQLRNPGPTGWFASPSPSQARSRRDAPAQRAHDATHRPLMVTRDTLPS